MNCKDVSVVYQRVKIRTVYMKISHGLFLLLLALVIKTKVCSSDPLKNCAKVC